MKVKNIVFSGVMGAILMGATGAHAAISVASQGYVDAKVGKVATSVTELGTTVSSTYQTKADAATAAQQTSAALDLKANAADVYTKEYVNTELAKLELKTDAIDKLNAAKDYTEEQINALKGALGTGGEGEEGGTGLTGQVLTNTSDIVSLKDKVGDKTVAQSIADAIGGLSAASVGAEGSFISTVSQADGTVTAGATPFVAEINDATKTSTVAPQTAAVKTYVDAQLNVVNQANSSVAQKVGALETAVTAKGALIDQFADYKTSNDGRVDALETDNTTNKADIGTLKDTVAKLDGTGEGSVAKALTDAQAYADGKASEAQSAAEATAAGALASAKTELEDKISAAQSAATYDDTKVKADIAANAGDISTIKGEQTTQNNAITALQESLAAGGATADAIADAKKAGTDAAAAAATAQAQADKGVADAAAAKSAADAAQADADTNANSISQLQTDLATKITAPAACEKQDCVLSINKASGTISWVPLTEPVADYL